MIPRFFQDMPRPKAGRFTGAALMATPRSPELKEVRAREFNGLLRAYLYARFSAFWLDAIMGEEVAIIQWAVRDTNQLNTK